MTQHIQHFINGKLFTSNSGKSGPVFNPATGEISAQVAFANTAEVEQAIAAAKAAFPAWHNTPPIRRTRIMFHYRELIEQHIDELAQLVTNEHGKTLADARGSVQRGLEVLEFVCGGPNLLKGQFTEQVGTDLDSYSLRQPLGVCAGITPFNFPAMVPLWMFPLALLCGNTFILKPSEKDPSCVMKLAELLTEAGLPAGVFNVINGDKEAVDCLLSHPDIAAVSSVGSTAVAEYIYRTASAHGKRVQAFGGAKNHAIVMPDADLDQTADAIVGAAYGSAGERCMAISAVIAVGDATADTLIERMLPSIQALNIGPGHAENIDMGPLITQAHLHSVEQHVTAGVDAGAKLLVDGRGQKPADHDNGFFMGPCLFDHVQQDMSIYQQEIFGPVLSVLRVDNFAEALQLVNDHEYGNGTAIFTRDGDTARTFARDVQVGMVGINVPIPVPVAYHSFGGWKRSLFGDLHMHGAEGVQFYTKLKTVTARWPQGIRSGADFHMPVHG